MADMTFKELIGEYPPVVQEIAVRARELILDIFPEAVETIDPSDKVIGYGTGSKYADLICTIMPQQNWVTLGIYKGADLPDPEGLLEGKGKVHRHVKLKTVADVQSSALRNLLQAARATKTA